MGWAGMWKEGGKAAGSQVRFELGHLWRWFPLLISDRRPRAQRGLTWMSDSPVERSRLPAKQSAEASVLVFTLVDLGPRHFSIRCIRLQLARERSAVAR